MVFLFLATRIYYQTVGQFIERAGEVDFIDQICFHTNFDGLQDLHADCPKITNRFTNYDVAYQRLHMHDIGSNPSADGSAPYRSVRRSQPSAAVTNSKNYMHATSCKISLRKSKLVKHQLCRSKLPRIQLRQAWRHAIARQCSNCSSRRTSSLSLAPRSGHACEGKLQTPDAAQQSVTRSGRHGDIDRYLSQQGTTIVIWCCLIQH